jgi:hypothetical protein
VHASLKIPKNKKDKLLRSLGVYRKRRGKAFPEGGAVRPSIRLILLAVLDVLAPSPGTPTLSMLANFFLGMERATCQETYSIHSALVMMRG